MAERQRLLDLENQPRRIPPDKRRAAPDHAMQAGTHGAAFGDITFRAAIEDRIGPEARAAEAGRSGRSRHVRRVEGGIEHAEPALDRPVAADWCHQKIADEPLDIGERLLAVGPECDPGMRAHAVEQHRDGLGDRAAIAPTCRSRNSSRASATSAASGGIAARSIGRIGFRRRSRGAPSSPGTCRNSNSALSFSAKNGPRNVAKTLSPSSGYSIAVSAARSAIISSQSRTDRPPTRTCGMRRASSART